MPSNRYVVTLTVRVDAQTEDEACALACKGFRGIEFGMPDVDNVKEDDYGRYETVPSQTVFNDGRIG